MAAEFDLVMRNGRIIDGTGVIETTKKPPSREGGLSRWLRGPATTETDTQWSSLFDQRYVTIL